MFFFFWFWVLLQQYNFFFKIQVFFVLFFFLTQLLLQSQMWRACLWKVQFSSSKTVFLERHSQACSRLCALLGRTARGRVAKSSNRNSHAKRHIWQCTRRRWQVCFYSFFFFFFVVFLFVKISQ